MAGEEELRVSTKQQLGGTFRASRRACQVSIFVVSGPLIFVRVKLLPFSYRVRNNDKVNYFYFSGGQNNFVPTCTQVNRQVNLIL